MDLITLNDLMFVVKDEEISLRYEVMVAVESLIITFTVPTEPIGYREEVGLTLHSHCGTIQINIVHNGQNDQWCVKAFSNTRSGKFKREMVQSHYDSAEELKAHVEESHAVFSPGDSFYIKLSCGGSDTSVQVAKMETISISGFPQIVGVNVGYTGGGGHTPNVSKDYLAEIFHADWMPV